MKSCEHLREEMHGIPPIAKNAMDGARAGILIEFYGG